MQPWWKQAYFGAFFGALIWMSAIPPAMPQPNPRIYEVGPRGPGFAKPPIFCVTATAETMIAVRRPDVPTPAASMKLRDELWVVAVKQCWADFEKTYENAREFFGSDWKARAFFDGVIDAAHAVVTDKAIALYDLQQDKNR